MNFAVWFAATFLEPAEPEPVIPAEDIVCVQRAMDCDGSWNRCVSECSAWYWTKSDNEMAQEQ